MTITRALLVVFATLGMAFLAVLTPSSDLNDDSSKGEPVSGSE